MESKQRPLQAKSLRVFVERNQGLKGMRLSMSPYREQDWLANFHYIPYLQYLDKNRVHKFVDHKLVIF